MASASAPALARQAESQPPSQSSPRAVQQTRTQYSIPAGPLGDLLARFEQASGVRLTLAMDSLALIQSPGVSGFYTVQQALEQLVSGDRKSTRLNSSHL